MKPPLRILTFLHSFEAGGVERVALRLAGKWAASGCDVVLALGRRTGTLEREMPRGVVLDVAPAFAWARHAESLWLAPHLVAAVRRHRPDVLFCAGNTYAIVAVLARAILGRACPPVVCKISNTLERHDFNPAMRWFYRRWLAVQAVAFDRFVGLAEPMRAELGRALPGARGRIDIVPDPALRLDDIPQHAPTRPRRAAVDLRLFLAVGRLTAQKDFAHLLRAFALVPGTADHLVILGEGPERAGLERLARTLGIVDRVQMPGHSDAVAAWLDRADALVLSSRYEGVPAVVVEALARGTPIAATDCCPSMGELIGQGRFGCTAPVGDAPALAQAMTAVCRRTYEVDAMRELATRFTVERAAPLYLNIMAGLAPLNARRRSDS